ncbi:hypothetical protein EBB07_29495 [Paenibacillaceae bacterium]|nr:hypothetical protein EBB07_29495 [Paenibacillaceae bacterium]
MSKFDIVQTSTLLNFSKKEVDVIKAGVDLYKHYLFTTKGKLEYAEYAKDRSYEEKEQLFNKNLIQEAVKRSGLTFESYDINKIIQKPVIQNEIFALISETLAVIIPNTVIDSFGPLAEVRNGNWGDNFKFSIPNPSLFKVNRMSNGQRRGEPQRLYEGEDFLTPAPREVTIQEDLYRILAGKVNWGDWITRIALSVQTEISTEVYRQLYDAYNNLIPNFKEGAFNKDAFVQLSQRVRAANRGAKASVFGTQLALSKIVPDGDFSKYGYVGLGEEYNRNGYLRDFMGVSAFMVEQRIVPNDPEFNFSIEDDRLFFLSLATDRPVKIGFEGVPQVFQSNASDHADLTQVYTYVHYWDTKVITSSKFGIMQI